MGMIKCWGVFPLIIDAPDTRPYSYIISPQIVLPTKVGIQNRRP